MAAFMLEQQNYIVVAVIYDLQNLKYYLVLERKFADPSSKQYSEVRRG